MSDAILTFQVQLSGVMETVLKSAMFEITRLVEHSFLEEVARSKQEVEALRQRLEWSESRCREREGGGRSRCVDCGRVRVSSEGTEDRPSGTQSGAEGAPPLPLSKSCSEPEWSPAVRQDTAPASGSLLPEQQSSGHRAEETCGLYESGQERVAHSLSLAGRQRCSRQHNDPNSERVTWTTFKLGDSDNEADGLDPSPAAVPEPASPSAQRDLPPGLAEEGAGNSVSPLQYLNVKSEGGVADWLLIKEEAEMQPVCSEEIRWDVAHREPWDRGDLQVENTAHLPPLQDAVSSLQSFSEKVESLTLRFRQQQKQLRQAQSLKAAQNAAERHVDPTDASGCTSRHKAFTEKRTKVDMREITAEASLDPVDRNRGASWDNELLNVSNKIQRGFTGDKPFSCVQCGKSFTQLKNLQAHLKHHAGERPHRCTQCGKSFLYQSRLKVHLLSHTGEKPFSCTYCEKSFLSLYNLKVHQRNHTGEKPYSCTQCGKGFTRLSILKEHRIIHSKEKSFCCTLCGKRFTRPSNLKAHLRRHIVAKQHGCTLCGKSFLYLCHLKKHQKKFHWTEAS